MELWLWLLKWSLLNLARYDFLQTQRAKLPAPSFSRILNLIVQQLWAGKTTTMDHALPLVLVKLWFLITSCNFGKWPF